MKDRKIQIRLSEYDLELLEKKSAELGMGKSEFIRFLVYKFVNSDMPTKADS